MAAWSLKNSPRTFKVLVTSALIENIAFGLIIPFLTLYMVIDIGIPEVLAGVVLMTYTVSGMPSVIIGGALADKLGRRIVLLSSLGLMSITMLMYFFAYDFRTLVILAFADSFVGSMYMPAANAMIADIIPSADRPKAYSMLRISWNVGIVVGPVIGAALVIAYPIKVLFVFGSLILAGAFCMNFVFIRETKPKEAENEEITFRKVLGVAKDRSFALIAALSGVFWFFFSQLTSVLPVYTTGDLGLAKSSYALLIAISSFMVVALQMSVTARTVNYRKSVVLLAGQLMASVGIGSIFFATDFITLLICISVMTCGEIVYMSIISAVIADLAPEARRGTYMGFSGFVQIFGGGVGFLFGMWLLDVIPERSYVWPIFGLIGVATSVGYITFARMIGPEQDRPSKSVPLETAGE